MTRWPTMPPSCALETFVVFLASLFGMLSVHSLWLSFNLNDCSYSLTSSFLTNFLIEMKSVVVDSSCMLIFVCVGQLRVSLNLSYELMRLGMNDDQFESFVWFTYASRDSLCIKLTWGGDA